MKRPAREGFAAIVLVLLMLGGYIAVRLVF